MCLFDLLRRLPLELAVSSYPPRRLEYILRMCDSATDSSLHTGTAGTAAAARSSSADDQRSPLAAAGVRERARPAGAGARAACSRAPRTVRPCGGRQPRVMGERLLGCKVAVHLLRRLAALVDGPHDERLAALAAAAVTAQGARGA